MCVIYIVLALKLAGRYRTVQYISFRVNHFNSDYEWSHVISHYWITLSSWQVTTKRRNLPIRWSCLTWCTTKFSDVTLEVTCGDKRGELVLTYWRSKDTNIAINTRISGSISVKKQFKRKSTFSFSLYSDLDGIIKLCQHGYVIFLNFSY